MEKRCLAAISKGKDKFRCGKEKFSGGIAYSSKGTEWKRKVRPWMGKDSSRLEMPWNRMVPISKVKDQNGTELNGNGKAKM